MSEFTGKCGHLLGSDGWCDVCNCKVKITRMDGKTSRELGWEDEQVERENENEHD